MTKQKGKTKIEVKKEVNKEVLTAGSPRHFLTAVVVVCVALSLAAVPAWRQIHGSVTEAAAAVSESGKDFESVSRRAVDRVRARESAAKREVDSVRARESTSKSDVDGARARESAAKRDFEEADKDRKAAQWRFDVTKRLQGLVDEASALELAKTLDTDAVADLERRLVQIEKDAQKVTHQQTVRDVLAIVSVVRGSLRKRVHGLTDSEVAQAGDAFSYSDAAYWESYYNGTDANETYEWLAGWDTSSVLISASDRRQVAVRELLAPHLVGSVLMLGCGNSDMSERMYKDGFKNITNVDISKEALVRAQARLPSPMPEMRWLQQNASAMDFPDEHFDVIIDKATLDTLEFDVAQLKLSVLEAHRVLRRGGLLVSMSFRSAEQRVQRQLRHWASWGECELHVLEHVGKVTRSVTYIHLCRRS